MLERSEQYAIHQINPVTAIHDGRGPADQHNQSPPIRIYHPMFAKYEAGLSSANVDKRDLEVTRELCTLLTRTDTGWENRRNILIRQVLTKFFGVPFQVVQNDDQTVADGAYMIQIGSVDLPVIIVELKRWFGEGGSDPFIQAELIFLRYWAQESVRHISCWLVDVCLCIVQRCKFCYQSHCPTFLLAGTGATFGVMGAVLTERVIAEHLSPIHVFMEQNAEQCSMMFLAARSLCALRDCIQEVPEYWQQLASRMSIHDSPAITSKHPRFFPYPSSYNDGSKTVHFRYIRRLEMDDICQTFLAKTDDKQVVVKFVSTYGVEVHEYLHRERYAPELYYFDLLPGYPTNLLRPHLPPDIPYIKMYMVVMEYIPPRPYPSRDILVLQLQDALAKLHEKGFVFGDLRPPNVLFDGERVRLIDFNWAGRYNVDEEVRVPTDVQERIKAITNPSLSNTASLLPNIAFSHSSPSNTTYARYPVFMSNTISWPDGVGPRDYILPWHDLDMLTRLF